MEFRDITFEPEGSCFPVARFVDALDLGFDSVGMSVCELVFEAWVVNSAARVKPLSDSVVIKARVSAGVFNWHPFGDGFEEGVDFATLFFPLKVGGISVSRGGR